jgi:D-alanyl-D-alanine carboxypeptidase
VRDGLLLDDSYFDGERWNPAWGSPSARAYHAPVAALTTNYGAFSVEVAPPPRGGLPAHVSIDPPVAFFQLTSAVKVGGDAPIGVDRESDGDRERVRVGGSIRPGGETVAVQRSVTDPVHYAAAVLRTQLAALGVDLNGLSMVDGSGLAAADRVTPRTLVSALRTARNAFAFGPEFAAALPIAGRDGTLKKRAASATDRARAKTGLIDGVAALSGYARTADGRDLVFSILNNGSPAGDAAATAANDAFVEALTD